MLVFDEKKYAASLLNKKNFNTYRNRDIERYIIIRYLASQNKNIDEIKKNISKFPLVGCEYLSSKDIDIIYDKIIEKALSYNLIYDIEIEIYEEELSAINELENEDAKKLLFILLVYYKWAINIDYLYFVSKKNDIKMVVTNDIDIWKLTQIKRCSVRDRYKLFNILISSKLYIEDNFKDKNYFFIPFIKNSGNVKIKIDNYDNIIGEYNYYFNKDSYKRCANCGTVISKTRSPKKYCTKCSKLIKNKQIKKCKKKKA